jgi:hypothetical protein
MEDNKSCIAMIGLLAKDIREDWGSNVHDRLDAIIDLCRKIGEKKWIFYLEDYENRKRIIHDGRYMMWWGGPYGGNPNDIDDNLWKKYKCYLKNTINRNNYSYI